ncbi:Nucleoside phosphorylase domain protein [Akanthomyces lecanii RCEF 1005]|uniref:Nucleoside phosphorylase domain protein n=1 Tax=Akanthomyces lecanii RCEF 1005 TaxID=1081108 RepID=A0A168F933_CORDF|nr:Nucleoside phosphorylase domain protein [Akanthomyces lecanii RCEF 1005]
MSSAVNRPKARGSYTVGFICALNLEMSAVRYLLDCEHPGLPLQAGDSNLYILGELSGYNIVLAWLPGNQGKGAAATVATNLNRSFPAIEWRFLVGIGGGVPSDSHDIRLGDVVISMPEGQHGGVVQYDLGKDEEEGFKLKGFLLPPPAQLRNAVVLMQSNHLIAENKINAFISQMTAKSPRLSIYRRPPSEEDVLFAIDYAHDMNQSTCRSCDRKNSVQRRARDADRPEIHYGLIASGDRVMRSAAKRQATVRHVGDILCFEMEAAGILIEYPCIAIRGISDYSDSHKNDRWQYYAAATAAAAAKELLSCIPVGTHEPARENDSST